MQKLRRKTEKRNSMGKRCAGEITEKRNNMGKRCAGEITERRIGMEEGCVSGKIS